jgi:hypothetical protein
MDRITIEPAIKIILGQIHTKLVGRFLGSNRMLAGTEVVKCPCEMRAWSLSTKVLL